jgi:hypothetical protein
MKRFFVVISVIVIGLVALAVAQQQGPNTQTLAVKKLVADRLRASLVEPFVGVRTSEGITEGLFPVPASGVSTEPIRKAAAAFIASLTPDHVVLAQLHWCTSLAHAQVIIDAWRRAYTRNGPKKGLGG